jgi:hypothetical protein
MALLVQILSDIIFVFALFNLFSRIQCIALPQKSVIQIEHVQLHFATTNMKLIQLLGLEATRYTGVYVQKIVRVLCPRTPKRACDPSFTL